MTEIRKIPIPKLVKWICECGNIVISEVEQNPNNKRFYTDFYCKECCRRNPLNELLVQELKKEAK